MFGDCKRFRWDAEKGTHVATPPAYEARAKHYSADTTTIRVTNRKELADLFQWSFHKLRWSPGS